MPDSAPFISFPERYLGERPAKFPLLVNQPGYFAINKPAGMACFRHDWNAGKPDISMALRRELLNEKPQLKALGIEGLFRVYRLDAELSGVLLYAKTEAWEETLRNAFGSRQLVFRYHLLASAECEERDLHCDLPIALHSNGKRMLVSHKTGKKCETQFQYLRSFGRYQLWEATTREMRAHQIRIHAAERDLRIVGETEYAQGEQIYLSMIKKGFRRGSRRENPIYSPICVHLVSVDLEVPGETWPGAQAPLPKGFVNLLKKLDTFKGPRR